jgi:hypothetical protein
MYEIARPFVRVWDWAGSVGGFPGQMFFVVGVIMLFIGIATYIGNRK